MLRLRIVFSMKILARGLRYHVKFRKNALQIEPLAQYAIFNIVSRFFLVFKVYHNNANKSTYRLEYRVISIPDANLINMGSVLNHLQEVFNIGNNNSFAILENADKMRLGYSHLCLQSKESIKVRNGALFVNGQKFDFAHNPQGIISYIENKIQENLIEQCDIDTPFIGGYVGNIGYNFAMLLQNIKSNNKNELGIYDINLEFYSLIISLDYIKNRIVVCSLIDKKDNIETLSAVCNAIEGYLKIKNAANHLDFNIVLPRDLVQLKNKMDSEFIKSSVKICKQHILEGDVSQVVPSVRVIFENGKDYHKTPTEIYHKLRILNPSQYMFFINNTADGVVGEYCLIGSSPESLFNYDLKEIETRAIAGTRRRGQNAQEDERLKLDLINDPKEISEHNMLVDLARNDIGMSAEIDSVYVSDYMSVEKYSNVMHIVSKVRGKLRSNISPFMAMLNVFPAGTVSGAPKRKAMAIINEVENCAREFYSGAICCISMNGFFDSCIAIRTCCVIENKVVLQAGVGVVSDSVPELEEKEVFNKLRGIASAVLL